MRPIHYIKAAGSFCSTLFSKGSLAGTELPEVAWAAPSPVLNRPNPRFALFCFQGTHEGEVFLLTQQTTFLGTDANASVVLTAPNADESSAYQIELDPRPLLRAQAGAPFLLNGRPATQAEIFDYDEVDLLGNRFLLLDLFSESPLLRGSQ